jgi:hypothetical protein
MTKKQHRYFPYTLVVFFFLFILNCWPSTQGLKRISKTQVLSSTSNSSISQNSLKFKKTRYYVEYDSEQTSQQSESEIPTKNLPPLSSTQSIQSTQSTHQSEIHFSLRNFMGPISILISEQQQNSLFFRSSFCMNSHSIS